MSCLDGTDCRSGLGRIWGLGSGSWDKGLVGLVVVSPSNSCCCKSCCCCCSCFRWCHRYNFRHDQVRASINSINAIVFFSKIEFKNDTVFRLVPVWSGETWQTSKYYSILHCTLRSLFLEFFFLFLFWVETNYEKLINISRARFKLKVKIQDGGY